MRIANRLPGPGNIGQLSPRTEVSRVLDPVGFPAGAWERQNDIVTRVGDGQSEGLHSILKSVEAGTGIDEDTVLPVEGVPFNVRASMGCEPDESERIKPWLANREGAGRF